MDWKKINILKGKIILRKELLARQQVKFPLEENKTQKGVRQRYKRSDRIGREKKKRKNK